MGYAAGLQYGSMDTFPSGEDIDGYYVEGLSLTVRDDSNTRVHVWSYAVGWSDDDASEDSLCPCLGGPSPPAFVGDDFYCESGRTGGNETEVWYEQDPLWDGDGTGTDCDTAGNPSYFVRDLGAAYSGPIEGRLLADQSTGNEDVGLTRMVLYVR